MSNKRLKFYLAAVIYLLQHHQIDETSDSLYYLYYRQQY